MTTDAVRPPTTAPNIALLLRSVLLNLFPQRRQLLFRQRTRVSQEVGDRLASERVDDPVDHRSHRLAVCPTFLHSVIDLPLAFPSDCNEVFSDKAVKGGCHARVGEVPAFADLLVDRSRSGRPEVTDRSQDRQLKLAKFHTNTRRIVI